MKGELEMKLSITERLSLAATWVFAVCGSKPAQQLLALTDMGEFDKRLVQANTDGDDAAVARINAQIENYTALLQRDGVIQ